MAESEASSDEQLDLKKRARRRLVGATALALLAAIVLPMVMDHEPRPPAQDIQVRIPSQDGGGIASRILPGKPTATPLPPAEVRPAPEPKADAKVDAAPEVRRDAPKAEAAKEPAKEVPKEPPKAAAVAAHEPAAAKTADKPVAAKSADKPAEKTAEKPADKAAPKPVADKAEEARAADALSGAGTASQWVVQLGAYKEAGNVKLLLAKLKGIGVPAFSEKFDSPQGPRTRVRAGPFPDKEAAEKARGRIKIIGVDGPVAPK